MRGDLRSEEGIIVALFELLQLLWVLHPKIKQIGQLFQHCFLSLQTKNYKMKKQEINPITLEIKSLSKKFKSLNRDNIRIVHQFCQYDLKRTQKVMTLVEEMKNPLLLIESLIKKPEKSEEILGELQMKYDKHFGQTVQSQFQKEEENTVSQAAQVLGYEFFQNIHDDTLTTIMSFLDPYSFFKFSMTSRKNYKISLSQAHADYYKRLCTAMFRMEGPKLPQNCHFYKIRDYVLERPLQFRPNTRNAVQNNLRKYIWKIDFFNFLVEPSYYKQFGSYENLYKRCPRLNLNGYYVLRDKYIKIGEKDDKNPVTPIHVIYYYRYLRFLQDGTVLYHVRNKKLKQNQILTYLSKGLLEDKEQKQTMIGEYVHYKDKVYVKTVRSREVFSYQFQIRSTENQISNQLKTMKYTLQLIDDYQQILQTLYQANPKKQDVCFTYCKNTELSLENSLRIQSCSL